MKCAPQFVGNTEFYQLTKKKKTIFQNIVVYNDLFVRPVWIVAKPNGLE